MRKQKSAFEEAHGVILPDSLYNEDYLSDQYSDINLSDLEKGPEGETESEKKNRLKQERKRQKREIRKKFNGDVPAKAYERHKKKWRSPLVRLNLE